jgi:hypothetical protein
MNKRTFEGKAAESLEYETLRYPLLSLAITPEQHILFMGGSLRGKQVRATAS